MTLEECPYCNKETEINHDDGYGLGDSEIYHQECDHCSKTFAYTTSIIIDHKLKKADCLNGGAHRYQRVNVSPTEEVRMYCEVCGESTNAMHNSWNKIKQLADKE